MRELRDHLHELAYTTVLSMCVRMTEKGLLAREHAPASDPVRSANAYIYTPRCSEAALLSTPTAPDRPPPKPAAPWGTDRASVEWLLAYLGTLRDAAGGRCSDAALDAIAALLERAERAERASGALSPAPRPLPVTPRAQQRIAPVEYRGRVCRVCGRQAPPPPAHRHDDLRVCRDEQCRKEARRRDNLAKQLRSRQKRQQAAQAAQ